MMLDRQVIYFEVNSIVTVNKRNNFKEITWSNRKTFFSVPLKRIGMVGFGN